MRISLPAGRRRIIVAGIAVASLLAVAGCDLATAANTAPEPKKGGTLFINLQGGIGQLDPQRTYNATDMNILRLTTRTLTTYTANPNGKVSEIVPDLATDTGRPSENNTVWKFTLKPNVKWEGGEPVLCSQIKYGIERFYSSVMDGGVPYVRDYLVDNSAPYQGPWVGDNNGGKGLESIQCTDEHNIVFHLSKSVGDFGYTVALSTFAPVPTEKDTHLDYEKHPYSNGPYKLAGDLDPQKGLTLVRNGFWTETNDQVRKAYPDKIVFDFRPDDSGVVTNQLIEDQGDARSTVMLDSNVAPNFLQQVVNDPDLVKHAITGPTGAIRYFSINTQVVKNIACRQALIYAFDKRKFRAVGGGSVSGDYATTMIPPDINGHKNFDLFDSLSNPEGQPEKTIAIMKAQQTAGNPCPSVIKVAFNNTPQRRRQLNTVVEAYQLAGIQVQLVPIESRVYYETGIGDTTNPYAMMIAGWVPDWANGSAILPALFNGGGIAKVNPVTGHSANNTNFSLLDDSGINSQIKVAQGEADVDRQATLWGDLDQQIQAKAVTVPVIYEKAIRLTGSNVLGGYISPAYGMPDLCALGLAQA
jgi:peptide/nickel transport system substrate-binding protein